MADHSVGNRDEQLVEPRFILLSPRELLKVCSTSQLEDLRKRVTDRIYLQVIWLNAFTLAGFTTGIVEVRS